MLSNDLARALDPVKLAEDCGIQPDPWQAQVLRSRSPRMLLLCSRQVGKSTITAVKALHTALYRAKSLILCVAPAERQSVEWFRRCIDCYRTLGRPVPADTENKLELELANGSRIAALPGKENTLRSYSGVSLLLLDEASRIPDDTYKAVRPMLAVSGGALMGLSTPFGKRGWFWEAWDSGGDGWERVKVPASECPRITPEFLEEERRALGDLFFAQEYFVEFVATSDNVFPYDLVMGVVTDKVKPLWEA